MADHEDYLPGETPALHATTHEDGGSDEISLLGLDGQSNALLAHSLIPTAHQDAPALIDLHAAIEDAHHARYTDGEARAAINDIFGADGKADADIDLDGHDLKGGSVILPNGEYIGIGAAFERLVFYTAGYAAFMGCNVGIGLANPSYPLHVVRTSNDGLTRISLANTNAGANALARYDLTAQVAAGSFTVTSSAQPGTYLFNLPNQMNIYCNLDLAIGTYGATSTLKFFTGGYALTNPRMSIDASGNVDIIAHDGATLGLNLGGNLVTYGLDDSGGAGFKLLRVPN